MKKLRCGFDITGRIDGPDEVGADGVVRIHISVTDVLLVLDLDRFEEFRVPEEKRGAFVADVLAEAFEEQEDGTTRIHELLERCVEAAIDNGSANVEEAPLADESEAADG